MKGVKDMIKFFKSVFCLILSFAMIASLAVLATAENEMPVEIKAKAAVLMDASTGKVLMKYK